MDVEIKVNDSFFKENNRQLVIVCNNEMEVKTCIFDYRSDFATELANELRRAAFKISSVKEENESNKLGNKV